MEIKLQFRTDQLPEGVDTQIISVPDYNAPADTAITLWFEVFFHKSQQWVEVMAQAVGPKGLKVWQKSDTYVQADILHSRSEVEEQCTVRCPQTGESRSGKGACIECKTAAGTVKICC